MVLQKMLEKFTATKAEIEAKDIDAFVREKLAEAEKQIRAEAEAAKAYELKVIGIKIEAIEEAIDERNKIEAELKATAEPVAEAEVPPENEEGEF